MVEKDRQPDSGAKRSEVVTIRLGPKLKYLAELAARTQHRTLSSFIEWAVDESLSRVLVEGKGQQLPLADADRQYELWDVDEADRLVRLGLHYPALLTHDEQVMWKLIRENGTFWRARQEGNPPEFTWKLDGKSVHYDRVRQHWPEIREVARGKLSADALPRLRVDEQHKQRRGK